MLLILLIYIGMFSIFPIITTPFILFPIIFRTKYTKIFHFLFILGISLITLRYVPYPTDDGAYHYKAAYLFQAYDNVFEWFFYTMARDIPTEYEYYNYPLFGLLLYIFSKTGTYSLVSFIVIFIVYYLYSSIILDIYRKCNISKVLFIISFLAILVFVNIRYTTSGMRYSLAVALTIYLFYREIKNGFKFNRSVILYFIPILIHSSIIVFVALRVIFPLIKKVRLYKKLIVLLTVPILAGIILPIFKALNIEYLSFLIDKFNGYQDTENYIKLFNISDFIFVYMGVFVAILYIIFYDVRLKFQNNKNIQNFHTLALYICLLTLSMIPFLTILDRFIWFVYPSIIISSVLSVTSDISLPNRKYVNNKYIPVYFLILLCFIGGVVWNKKFIDFLLLIDYDIVEIFTKNIFEYFSDLHQFSLSEVVRR